MKLNRFPGKGFCFENKMVAIGKCFGKGYFVTLLYPFVGFGKEVYKSENKPRFINLILLSILFSIPYVVLAFFGALWMLLYTLYTILGAANVINGIKESKELGGLINLVSIFCLTAFYLIGIFSLILFLIK